MSRAACSGRSDRWSAGVESSESASPETSRFHPGKANNSSPSIPGGRRVSRRRLLELADDLSGRDRLVLDTLGAVRVLSGGQLERLLFAEVAESARGRVRRRVLGRLVSLGLVVPLERRVGGVRAGSAGLVYALSGAGARLLDLTSGAPGVRRRQPHTPGALFLAHALAVSEVYVSVVEATRSVGGLRLVRFAVEQDARWTIRDSRAPESLRPDALVVLEAGDISDLWWLEVDRGTESLPRLRAMMGRYLDFAGLGVPGPGGVVPRVLITVTDERRGAAVESLVRRLPPPASELFVVCLETDAAGVLVSELLDGGGLIDEPRKPP